MNHQVTVPDWTYNLILALYHNWPAGIVVVISAVVLSAITFALNRHWTKKQQEAVLDRTLHFVMVGLAAVFGLLGQLIPFLHDNLSTFSSIPHIGEYMVSVYAAANFLYALKLKTWFQAFVTLAGKRSKTDVSKLTDTSGTVSAPTYAPDPNDF